MSAAGGIKARPFRTAALLAPLLVAAFLHLPSTVLAATGDTIRPAAAAEPAIQTLNAADRTRYQTIFDLQQQRRFADADREIARLQDKLLLGHVLLQRYLPPAGAPAPKVSYQELAEWMAKYRDHPGAADVYKLAMTLKGKKDKAPPGPSVADPGEFSGEPLSPNLIRASAVRKKRSPAEQRTVSQAEAALARHLRDGRIDLAEKVLERADVREALSTSEFDNWRRRAAHYAFMAGKDERALALASAAARRSRDQVPDADWFAGLAAWRLGRYDNAAHHFEQLAFSDTASTWDTAAGAFWAARVMLKLRQPQEFRRMLERAAEYPRTFYGQLAVHQLGIETPLVWQSPPLKPEDAQKLAAIPAVRRAVALSELGQITAAEREMRQLRAPSNNGLAGALLALAHRLETPAALYQLGLMWRNATGEHVDVALYPLPPWEPENGFQVDRALVFAFMRQESAFNARALSPAGASGLMQLMPATASFVAGQSNLRQKQNRHRLFAPEYNIELGQRYLQHLLESAPVNGNLLYLAAAYNAGPGNLQRWLKELRFDDDPLLFTEMIPIAETREFVERVVTNLWIYRDRLGLPRPSLDNLTVGNWPTYDGGDRGWPGEQVATGGNGN
jgi:soluble lytic murein transglycosylase-like protein